LRLRWGVEKRGCHEEGGTSGPKGGLVPTLEKHRFPREKKNTYDSPRSAPTTNAWGGGAHIPKEVNRLERGKKGCKRPRENYIGLAVGENLPAPQIGEKDNCEKGRGENTSHMQGGGWEKVRPSVRR